MSKEREKEKGKARGKKLTVKKEPIKDLEPKDRQSKNVKGGFVPADTRKYYDR